MVFSSEKVKLVNKMFTSRGQHGLKNEQHGYKTSTIQDVVRFKRLLLLNLKYSIQIVVDDN